MTKSWNDEELHTILLAHTGAETILRDEPMSAHTTFRVGGHADFFVKVRDARTLRALLVALQKEQIPYSVVGNGSNLLVSDDGYRGVILCTAHGMKDIRADGTLLYAGAGALLADVVRFACDHALDGLVFASGIPGTVGGALFMNAGAFGAEMSDVVQSAQGLVVTETSVREKTFSLEELQFDYRRSVAKEQPVIFTSAVFSLQPGDKEDIEARMQALSEKRREKQPLEYPSAGSAFKRPQNAFAGKLIMDAGLKGFRVGGAQVAEKHCGFIINTGGATAADVRSLIAQVQDRVLTHSGIRLEPEVLFLGEF